MSGIAGILQFDGRNIDCDCLALLTARMQPLGPDATGHWINRPVALGHCLLRTTPESCFENQPTINASKNLAIVWDGRLDNRKDLKQELLAKRGSPVHTPGSTLENEAKNPRLTETDSELVLQSYACWGKDCVHHLSGDFAFVIWDSGQKSLYCARDHMGARPLYFTQNAHFFSFASEDEALLALPQVSRTPNERRIANSLLTSYLDGEPWDTWLRDIKTLPPAHWMSISADGASSAHCYWQAEAGEEHCYSSDGECEEAFQDVFGKAVNNRLRSTGSIAAMISGGLDSASILAMVRRQLPHHAGKAFHTYSAISDDPSSCIESERILSLTSHPDISSHFLRVPSFSGMLDVQDLLNVFWERPHPVDHSILLPAMMCLAAHRDGHRVMLHGMGGDQTMEVHGRYIGALMLHRKWREALRECWSPGNRMRQMPNLEGLMMLARNGWAAYAPMALKGLLYRLRHLPASSVLEGSLISREFARRLQLVETIQSRNLQISTAPVDIQREQIRATLPPYGHGMGLNGYNRVAGRFGIELRDPWSDRKVFEFWLRLPLLQKIRLGWSKYLVRRSFRSDLEQKVLWQKGKEHLGWSFVQKLVTESKPRIQQQLAMAGEVLEPWADAGKLSGLARQFSGIDQDFESNEVWSLLVLVTWLNRIRRE
jgi:asparagine synthase (glutamine-hydrolysing)